MGAAAYAAPVAAAVDAKFAYGAPSSKTIVTLNFAVVFAAMFVIGFVSYIRSPALTPVLETKVGVAQFFGFHTTQLEHFFVASVAWNTPKIILHGSIRGICIAAKSFPLCRSSATNGHHNKQKS